MLSRLAFYDDSPSSQAVLHAVLSVSSVRRQGLTVQAVEQQRAALQALELSSRHPIQGPKVAQHVAAGMLLCCFEVRLVAFSYVEDIADLGCAVLRMRDADS